MKSLISWFAHNSVAANILLLVIVASGVMAIPQAKIEVFPEFDLDRITINVVYPGSTPAEVEQNICVLIEEEIQDLDGIKKISSTAVEGVGALTIKVENSYSAQKLLEDLRTRVDGIDTLPELAERPVIQMLINRKKVINIALHGHLSDRVLKESGEFLRDEIMALPGITKAELAGARPYEISIEISELQLKRYHLSFDQVSLAIKQSSLDLPGGSVKTEAGQILLRTKGQAYRWHEFARIPIRTGADGSRLLLGDVAKIKDGFADTDESSTFNGEPTVAVKVFRTGKESALEVSALVQSKLKLWQNQMPEGLTLTAFHDDARVLEGRLDLMIRNAKWGLILVFIILALALKFDLAFWVVIGIPISFLGAFWVMPMVDVSINMISLFAFILVLGIVVDDAIVVGESIYDKFKEGKKGLEASVEGSYEVGVPVVFAVLTTIVAFTPMIGIPGFMGKIWRVIPWVVIPCLIFSLIESLLILPAHLSNIGQEKKRSAFTIAIGNFFAPVTGIWTSFQTVFANSIEHVSKNFYKKVLNISLVYRYATAVFFITLFSLSVALVKGKYIDYVFFPEVEADFLIAQVKMPEGVTINSTRKAVQQVEVAVLALKKEFDDKNQPLIKSVLASVGGQPVSITIDHKYASAKSTHLGEVFMELYPSENRDVSSKELEKRLREKVGEIVGVDNLILSSALAKAGDAINVQFASNNFAELAQASDELKELLLREPGVLQPRHDYTAGKEEIQFDITKEAEAYGLSKQDLARQIRQAFYGEESQRINRGRNEVKVMLRYPKENRLTLTALMNMSIRTAQGDELPFSQVAVVHYGTGFSSINRVNRKRVVTVSADVDGALGNAEQINTRYVEEVLPALLAKYPTLSYTMEGEQREQSDSMGAMANGGILAMFVIYALIAVVFRSYLQPFIVMSAIPFGFVGAVAGHMLFGMDLNIMSMCGLLALMGVVVNDSLVLVDYINRKVKEGLPLKEAALTAGVKRFRPILLTSLTTFAGLTPLLLERSMQARFLIPMAISLAFGVLFATLITLILLPGIYLMLEDFKAVTARFFGKNDFQL